ncbi:dna primase large subunit [Stylonychia lemnae]|uniref:DNA primase large subunit n=1 Tax=Stylonychia lemnae TaxID=5949 RepID=A0A077ZUR8_STYLE|nr:dna primase large subunit [Stylonychia lemnae]|eukprot:CDW72196.1 dna primase large subunit [Stylonychia lemnae]
MYVEPPENIISLHEFQKLALDRLQVLKKIEFMNDANQDHQVIKETVIKMTKAHRIAVIADRNVLSSFSMTTEERKEFRVNDNISHFICRLAYCRNEELRKWFLTQEARLFNIRLQDAQHEIIQGLLKDQCGISYQVCQESDEDWQIFRHQITFKQLKLSDQIPSNFVKVPFKEAISLVSRRAVFLHLGVAYVPVKELTTILSAHFRAKVSAELVKAYKFWPEIIKDERIQRMLINLSNHSAIDFNIYEQKAPTDGDKIKLSDLDYYSRKSFPPCMKSLFTVLRNKHHLKHYGRLQLGLFIKGLGLTMEEAYTFWKQEFCKNMDNDKFEKQYGYNIRHNFGKEGKKQDYKPWNCQKILQQTTPGPDEYHGCPFKTFSEEPLRQMLSSYGLKPDDMKVVIDKRRENLHQVACLRLYELSHPNGVSDNVGNHPNAFFNSSVQYIKDVEKNKFKRGITAPSTEVVVGTAPVETVIEKPKDVEMDQI